MTTPTTRNKSKTKDGADNDKELSFNSNDISPDEQLSQQIDSINFSTAYGNTNNVCESEPKSPATTSRTYAQVVADTEVIKKPETSKIQMIQPIVGKIYKFRYSLRELFDIADDGSSLVSSSSNSNSNKANKRPCLVIGKSSTSFDVLAITRFHGGDPRSEEVFPQLPKENLLKYILSIHPTPPIWGNRNVRITSSQSSSYFNPSEKSYIILKPVTFSLEIKCPKPLADYIANDELIFIRDSLLNIFIKERNQPITQRNNDEFDNITSTLSSSSSSSMPAARLLQQSFEDVDSSLNKSQQIEKWLANLNLSSECIIDLNN